MPGLHSNPTSEEVVEEAVQPEEKIFKEEDVYRFPQGIHIWRQQGPYIVCKDCELHHATYIGMNKEMYGEDENGKPLLRDRVSIQPRS